MQRFNFLFRSTQGLVVTAIAMISLVTAISGMLSGPMAELGVRDVVVRYVFPILGYLAITAGVLWMLALMASSPRKSGRGCWASLAAHSACSPVSFP